MTTLDKVRDNSEYNTFACPLIECDPFAYRLLAEEIEDCRKQGYDVTVGSSDDIAYEKPDKIMEVYHYLRKRDVMLEDQKKLVRRARIGQLGVNPLKWSYRRQKHAYSALEPMRYNLLFGPNEADAEEWHEQKGRATALLTIALAHDLEIEGFEAQAGYPTMSGMLDGSVLDYEFPKDSGFVSGMSVRDALVQTEMKYGGHKPFVAELRASDRLEATAAFINAPNSEKFVDIVRYCSDGLGIRSRKYEVSRVIKEHLIDQFSEGNRPLNDMLVLSFGCGTALPVLELMYEIRQKSGDCPQILLIDQDPLALASAAVLAKKMGLEDKIELRCEQLFSRLGKPLDISAILQGRKITVAEDSGLREYLPDKIYKALTRETWQHLEGGGLMTTGNMNENRPQREFLHGMMGWQPHVQMRQIKDGFRLHEESGISRAATRARLTRDGLYTLFFSQKDE